jgi:hypothetical protein
MMDGKHLGFALLINHLSSDPFSDHLPRTVDREVTARVAPWGGGSTVLDSVKSPVIEAQVSGGRGAAPWPLGSHYQYRSDRHELIRVVERIEDEHRASISRGVAEFALVLEGPLLVFCSRFGAALPWSGAAFHCHRLPRAERTLPPAGVADSGVGMDVRLIEARDGHVGAERVVTLPAPFARVLHEAILEQARFSYDPCAERRALEGLQRRCPTPGALLAYATMRTVAKG